MYTGAVFVAKYVPGQAIAKNNWQGWATWESTYDSLGITYMAGGNINIYDCPVDGQKIIGTLQNGMKLHLGQIVNDGFHLLLMVNIKLTLLIAIAGIQLHKVMAVAGLILSGSILTHQVLMQLTMSVGR
ncbi:hypothetical protein [Lactobacillus crispatus]|uniref:hypothetical protein n=1 Tax=Lactobacillus crispatus TaxID=47770 RepID=UPI00336A0FB4